MPDIKAMAAEAGFCEAWVGAGANPPNHPAPIDLLERFAQLVARECVAAVYISSNPSTHEGAHVNRLAREAIRARFGLEG